MTPVCLTPEPGHYCFGYYDRCPWDATGRYHLALKIPQQDRLPVPGEPATVGVIDLAAPVPRFRAIAETCAWNHQQGSMTQWLPGEPGCFVCNDAERTADGWHLVARVYRLDGTRVRTLPRPVYILAPDGRTAATLDFGRIHHRPGYAYTVADARQAPLCPRDVGVWTMDTTTGESRLILSIADFAAVHPNPYELAGTYLWLNHLGYNCDGTRLMVLLRYAEPALSPPWKTFLYTFNPDGSELRCALPDVYWHTLSHQLWGSRPDEIIVDANWRGRGAEFIAFTDGETTFRNLAPGLFGQMAHITPSRDGNWLVADSYPQGSPPEQLLRLIDLRRGTERLLGRFAHPPRPLTDLRCDLHPRLSPDNRRLSFDSTMSGERKLYQLDLSALTQA